MSSVVILGCSYYYVNHATQRRKGAKTQGVLAAKERKDRIERDGRNSFNHRWTQINTDFEQKETEATKELNRRFFSQFAMEGDPAR
jgi:hypothetical protein